MVRKEILAVSLMAGYPIDGKPKEHHNLPSGKQIVGFVVALIIVAAIAIFAGQTPVKTATDSPEVKTAEALATEQNVNTGQETAGIETVKFSDTTIYNVEAMPNILARDQILLYNMKIDADKKYLVGFIKVTDSQPNRFYLFGITGIFYDSDNNPVLRQTAEVLSNQQNNKLVYSIRTDLTPGKEYTFRLPLTKTGGAPVKNIKGVLLSIGNGN